MIISCTHLLTKESGLESKFGIAFCQLLFEQVMMPLFAVEHAS